jgi:membrane fusion protein (multidrug efflux system)
LDKTNNDVTATNPLAEQKAVSQQELDNALSAQEGGSVSGDRLTVHWLPRPSSISHTRRLLRRLTGLIGTTQKKVGALVGRGENTLLNTISQVNPILFRCAIAEAEYLRLDAGQAPVTIGPARKKFGVELILADGTVFAHKGRLDAIERAVDAATGTLTGQFSFPNPERILRPGQYGKARLVTDLKQDALLVPQLAVQEIQGLYNVMVVKPEATVEQRMVKAGERVGNLWIIDSGLKPGEKVIVEGLQKVKPGVQVNAKPAKLDGAKSPAPGAPPAESKAQGAERK